MPQNTLDYSDITSITYPGCGDTQGAGAAPPGLLPGPTVPLRRNYEEQRTSGNQPGPQSRSLVQYWPGQAHPNGDIANEGSPGGSDSPSYEV